MTLRSYANFEERLTNGLKKDMRNNAKFEAELTFHFKTDSRNLTNFDSSTQKSKKKCSLICSLSVQESCQVR